MKRILVTGFEPFGGETTNPSWEAVRLLPDVIGGCEVIKKRLCVEYAASGEKLTAYIDKYAPDIAVLCGQAGGRAGITIENCAINRDHSGSPDNAGSIRQYALISEIGAAAYFTDFDVRGMVNAVSDSGIKCAPSFSAGTYVCNHVYYTLLEMIAREHLSLRGLFVHVPFIPEQTQTAPAMELKDIARGLEIILMMAARELQK